MEQLVISTDHQQHQHALLWMVDVRAFHTIRQRTVNNAYLDVFDLTAEGLIRINSNCSLLRLLIGENKLPVFL